MVWRVRVWWYWTKLVASIKFIEAWRWNGTVTSISWWNCYNNGNYEVQNGKTTKWSLKPMAQRHVAHQVSWWHVKAYYDLVEHQVERWSTRWHEWSPDATVKHQVNFLSTIWLDGPPGKTVEQLCNGCAISGTMDKLCHCTVPRDTTTRSPVTWWHGCMVARWYGRYEVHTTFETRSKIKVLVWSEYCFMQ